MIVNVLKPFDVRVVLPSQSCAGDRHRRFGTPNGACVKGVRSSVQGEEGRSLGGFPPGGFSRRWVKENFCLDS